MRNLGGVDVNCTVLKVYWSGLDDECGTEWMFWPACSVQSLRRQDFPVGKLGGGRKQQISKG